MSKNDKKDEEPKQQPALQPQPVFPRLSRGNSGIATFSSMAKVAESLVNGGASIEFNSYNNNIVFKWVSQDINESLCLDIIERLIGNVASLIFTNGSVIKGISDGFTTDNRGQMVQQYDENIALSTAFGYEITQLSTNTIINLNTEIEARQSDSYYLYKAFAEACEACASAISLVHYLYFDLENHIMGVVIPVEVEDEEVEPSHGDALPSDTITMEEPQDGVYDPSLKVEEAPQKKFENKLVAQFDKDGFTVAGEATALSLVSQAGAISELQCSIMETEQIQSSVSISQDILALNSIVFPTCYVEDVTKSDGNPIETEHPLAGMSVSVPTEIPSPLDDNYVYYLFLGGIKGEKVKNPNLRGRHYIIQNDEPKYLTQRTTTLIGAEPINIIHFDNGNQKDVIPSQYEYVTLDDEFTFDENMTIYGTLFYPQYQIQGISSDWESPSSYTLPTTLAVSSLVAAGLEAASDDLNNALQVIASNGQMIATIQNSTGGLEDKNDASYNWVMWTYIKKWIIKGFNDFIKKTTLLSGEKTSQTQNMITTS